jgi:hypothetical protein
MSAPSGSAWIHAATRRYAGHSDLRVSDAERAEVADLLAKHYGDGRLDQTEFNERLEQAMKAKTYADLSGLFADLPRTGTPETGAPDGAPRTFEAIARRRHPGRRALFLVVAVVIAVAVGQAIVRSLFFWPFGGFFVGGFIPWLLIGLLVFLWLRHSDRR